MNEGERANALGALLKSTPNTQAQLEVQHPECSEPTDMYLWTGDDKQRNHD